MSKKDTLFLGATLVVAATAAITVLLAINRMTDSDAMGSLLVAESLATQGTIYLDNYSDLVKTALGYRLTEVNGHAVYAFPIGTSFIATPVAWVMARMGMSMVAHDHQVQIGLASLSAFLTVILAAYLARRFTSRWAALSIATVFWFGSALASTGGTALWSHNFGVVTSLAALLALTQSLAKPLGRSWIILALTLFAGFVIRPQLGLLAVLTLMYLLIVQRRTFWRTGFLMAALGLLFVGFNLLTVGSPLPDYYLASRLLGEIDFWTALSGNLISPGRGMLIYTPFLLALPLLAIARKSPWQPHERSLLFIALLWPVLHLIAISRFSHWWGGWAFGARLMMDVLPALILATAILWPTHIRTILQRIAVGTFLALGVFGIWINTAQGLFNPYTRFWYIEPNLDLEPQLIFDWRYPQFVNSETRQEQRLMHRLPPLEPITPGEAMGIDSPRLGLVGWSTGFISNGISLAPFTQGPNPLLAEGTRRWSEGNTARILFDVREEDVASIDGSLELFFDSLQTQPLTIAVNGRLVYEGIIGQDRAVVAIALNPDDIAIGPNEVILTFSDARDVGEASDFRRIAAAIWQVVLR